jgi:hypothetical protein
VFTLRAITRNAAYFFNVPTKYKQRQIMIDKFYKRIAGKLKHGVFLSFALISQGKHYA